jgi:hypothetical protein
VAEPEEFSDSLNLPAPAGIKRPWTDDEELPNGGVRIHLKRACNGCGQLIGDVNDFEIARAMAGLPLEDVRGECPTCSEVAS